MQLFLAIFMSPKLYIVWKNQATYQLGKTDANEWASDWTHLSRVTQEIQSCIYLEERVNQCFWNNRNIFLAWKDEWVQWTALHNSKWEPIKLTKIQFETRNSRNWWESQRQNSR